MNYFLEDRCALLYSVVAFFDVFKRLVGGSQSMHDLLLANFTCIIEEPFAFRPLVLFN